MNGQGTGLPFCLPAYLFISLCLSSDICLLVYESLFGCLLVFGMSCHLFYLSLSFYFIGPSIVFVYLDLSLSDSSLFIWSFINLCSFYLFSEILVSTLLD